MKTLSHKVLLVEEAVTSFLLVVITTLVLPPQLPGQFIIPSTGRRMSPFWHLDGLPLSALTLSSAGVI